MTVDSLFARMFAALGDSASILSDVVFDPQFGFPRSFITNRCMGCSHGRSHLSVDYFLVAHPVGSQRDPAP